jgi:hypothetical protein
MGIRLRLTPPLVAAGVFVVVIAVSAVGFNEWIASRNCTAAWEHAGDRTGDRLTDRAATPYLGMMMASKHEVPASYRVSRRDFVAACRSGAIRRVVLRDDDGAYLAPTPIAAASRR